MRRQIGKGRKTRTGRAGVLLAVELQHRLAEAEVARRPGVRAPEVPGEEPFRGPLADAGKRDKRRLHLVVREQREGVEVEICLRQTHDVLRLPPGEADRDDLLGARKREPFRVGKAYATSCATPKASIRRLRMLKAAWREICCALIEVTSVSNGSGTSGGGSLGARNEPREDRLRGRERGEGVEVERRAEVAAHVVDHRRFTGLDRDASGRRLDPHLLPVEDPIERAVAVQVGEIEPEGAVPLGRELEVERLRKRDCERQCGSPRRARSQCRARPGTRRARGWRRPGRTPPPRSGPSSRHRCRRSPRRLRTAARSSACTTRRRCRTSRRSASRRSSHSGRGRRGWRARPRARRARGSARSARGIRSRR